MPNNDGDVTAGGVADPEQFAECLPKFPPAPHFLDREDQCQRRTGLAARSPKSQGTARASSADRVRAVQNGVSDFPDVGGVGANGSEVVDVDQQHRGVEAPCWKVCVMGVVSSRASPPWAERKTFGAPVGARSGRKRLPSQTACS